MGGVTSELDKETGEYKLYPTSSKDALTTTKPGVWKIKEPITGYKKIRCEYDEANTKFTPKFIAKVTIPAGAKVVRSITDKDGKTFVSDKIRTDKFKVEDIYAMNSEGIQALAFTKCVSLRDSHYTYEKGKEHQPDKLDQDTTKECTQGLYFLRTEKEAFDY